MAGNIYDRARSLKGKSGRAIADAEKSTKGSRSHPSSKTKYRKKPKATSMAPNSKNKRKSYGRRLPETAAEERARKNKK